MKTFLIAVIFGFSVFACSGQTNDDSEQSPLNLILNVKKQKICIGRGFKITARLLNVSEKSVRIDKRNLWRSVIVKAVNLTELTERNESPTNDEVSLFNEILQQRLPRYQIVTGDGFEDNEVPKEHLFNLRPQKYYEDFILIEGTDDFFQKPGKYYVKSEYRQYRDWSSKNVILFIGSIKSNELELDLGYCK